MRALRNLLLLAISAAVSYLVLLHETEPRVAPPSAPALAELTVAPAVDETAESASPAPEPAPADDRPDEPTPPVPVGEPEREPGSSDREPRMEAPPPPEAGSPEGETGAEDRPESEPVDEPAPPPDPGPTAEEKRQAEAEKVRREIRSLTGSSELLRQAEAEVSGSSRKGFRTVFLCSGSDQLEIARWFDEPLVLVPREGLDPKNPYFYRLRPGAPAVDRVSEAAPLERYRQYRDLFAFPYQSLPTSLRDLRRSVVDRTDVYLFAAFIPPSEWALVIARRREALDDYNRRRGGRPRQMDEVRRVTMRYAPLPGGGFDIRVAQILFADGTHWTKE